jgi:hypothetical protein
MPQFTIDAEQEVIDLAHRLARERQTSVSELFRRYILESDSVQPPSSKSDTPITDALRGIAHPPEGMSYEQLLDDALREKYG